MCGDQASSQAAPTATAPPRHAKQRFDNIDLLRAIAILLVVAFHYTSRWEPAFYRAGSMPFEVPLGEFGVDLFFAVSGYCIFMTLDSAASLTHFWSSRIARLQPAYMVAILLTLAIVTAFGLPGSVTDLRIALANMAWTFAAIPDFPMVDGVYWSLVVELKFYFWIGLIYYFSGGKWVSLIWAAFAIVGALVALAGPTAKLIATHILLAQYAAAFLVGLLAYECRRLPMLATLALGAATLALLFVSSRFADYPLIGIAIGLFAFGVLQLRALKIPAAVSKIGLVSYSLYLIHQNIGLVVIRETAGFAPIEVRLALAFTVVLALALALHHAVELRWQKPLSRQLQRLLGDVWDRLPQPRLYAAEGEFRRW